ncbi:MAG: single-stranded DNA-binding protein [Bacilli bacterium]|jgi:single-stranded DNA-binding protein
MSNQFVIVGRLVEDVNQKEDSYTMVLGIPRSYKNSNGEYENDYVTVVALGNIGSQTKENCKLGDLIGIKGRIQSNKDNTMTLVAEKITFLSSKSKEA